jgi:hypothetical protein
MLPALLLLACSDTSFRKGVETNSATPDIEVSPSTLDLGAVPLSETAEASFTVSNVGDAALFLEGVELSQVAAAFELVDFEGGQSIAPGASLELRVRYLPWSDADTAQALVRSDDPDERELSVGLSGRAARPRLQVEPDPVDFGSVELCDEGSTELVLSNVGEDVLVIDQSLLIGDAYRLDPELPAPLSLAPGESTSTTLRFTPPQTGGSSGELWIAHNEASGSTRVAIEGRGVVDGLEGATDYFRQPDGPWERADLVFFVDRSCSMKDDEANMRANLGLLVEDLSTAGTDWQAMVTVDDNGCHTGDFFDEGTSDLGDAFGEALSSAPGTFTEAGLTILANGLERAVGGGCNDGFLRSDAKTIAVAISDEPEQSPKSWEHYVERIQRVAPTAAIVAIVGDLPDGCSTAMAGTGYVEAALASGGTALSICSGDWGRYFASIGGLVHGEAGDRFVLSEQPEPDSIQVDVDGEIWTGWSYEEATNEVVLGSRPEPLALITIRYDLGRTCPD